MPCECAGAACWRALQKYRRRQSMARYVATRLLQELSELTLPLGQSPWGSWEGRSEGMSELKESPETAIGK